MPLYVSSNKCSSSGGSNFVNTSCGITHCSGWLSCVPVGTRYWMISSIYALQLHVKTGTEDDNLETGALSAESCMEPTDFPEVIRGTTVAVVAILVRYHLSYPTFSCHVCNYDTLIGCYVCSQCEISCSLRHMLASGWLGQSNVKRLFIFCWPCIWT